LVQVSQAEISALSFSDESEGLVAIGSQTGEVLFHNVNNELVFTAQTKQGQNPHASRVIQIAWNIRVSRICCSLDENGTAIVWDLKKRGAVMSFNVKGGVSVQFSPVTATVLYVLNKSNEIEIWDLRQK